MTTNAPSRSPLRLGLRASALAAAGGLGFLLAAQPQPATADGLPLPTVSVPSLPITVPTVTVPTVTVPPVTLPTTTDPGTTTTATTGTTSSPAATSPGAPPATVGGSSGTPRGGSTPSGTVVSGAIRLSDGTFSIPVTSVRLPARLVLVVTVTPRSLQSQTQAIKASVRVRDTRGFLVRGARVAVTSVPAGRLTAPAQKRSGADGRATFVVRAKPAVLRQGGRLSLLVSAADPTKSRIVAVSRVVAVPIRLRR